jgi:hypothetical protein
MSNRLSFAHVAPRREPEEWMPTPRHGIVATAMRWLREAVETDAHDAPAAMQRDLGLPETAPTPVAFAYEIERSRVRV